MNEIFAVVSEPNPESFETAINERAAQGCKIVPMSVTITHFATLSRYECVMGRQHDPERTELEARAKKAGIHTLESFGV